MIQYFQISYIPYLEVISRDMSYMSRCSCKSDNIVMYQQSDDLQSHEIGLLDRPLGETIEDIRDNKK